MNDLSGYHDPCESCDAFCCKTYRIDDSRNSSFRIPIKVSGAVCENLDGKRCKIYERRSVEGFGDCVDYSCYGFGPIVQNWMVQNHVPFTYGGELIGYIKKYILIYFNIDSRSQFEKLDKVRVELFFERINDLLLVCPSLPEEFLGYWRSLISDLITRRSGG